MNNKPSLAGGVTETESEEAMQRHAEAIAGAIRMEFDY
jgi:hypothetical protein